MRNLRIIWLFILCITPLLTQAEDKAKEKSVTIVTLDNYAPYTFSDSLNASNSKEKIPPGSDSENFKGFAWETLKESFHAMGYTVYLSVRPWKRAVVEFEKGKYDILFPTTKTPEREKKYFYSEGDTNFSHMNIYTLKDSKFEFDGLESLKGMIVGTIRGYSYGAEWEKSDFIKKDETESDQQNFKKLDKKRIKGVVAYSATADYWLKENGLIDNYKKHESFAQNHEYLVALKDKEEAVQKVKDFDEGKKKIIESGLYDKIKKKWNID